MTFIVITNFLKHFFKNIFLLILPILKKIDSHNVGCYGTFPLNDWLFGTDVAYRKYKNQQKGKQN